MDPATARNTRDSLAHFDPHGYLVAVFQQVCLIHQPFDQQAAIRFGPSGAMLGR